MQAMKAYLPPLARLLMSSLFIWDGILQLRDPSGTAEYFANVHAPIPDVSVWISIVFHLLAGLGILVGFKIRWAAAALVAFCLGTAFGVHLAAGDFNNMIHFGFLYVMIYGVGAMSIDGVDEALFAFMASGRPRGASMKLSHANSSSSALASCSTSVSKPFGEPAVDRREKITGFGALALITPEPGEAS